MKWLLKVSPVLLLIGCQPICKAFPEWNEQPLQGGTIKFDVEHNSQGQVEDPVIAAIGDILEIPIDPACAIVNQLGIVTKK